MDIDTANTQITLGGRCDDNAKCGGDHPVPIIQLYNVGSYTNFVWSVYIPHFGSSPNRVLSLTFNPLGTKIAAAFNIEASNLDLTITVLNAATGAQAYSYSQTSTNTGTLYP